LAVGLHVMIVAHGYDKAHPTNRRLQHVLVKVMMDDGSWAYGDPSYNFPLGTCHPFTRERVVSLPDQRVLCDAEVCDVQGFNPDMPYMEQGGGTYIGLDGLIGVEGKGHYVFELTDWSPLAWIGQEPQPEKKESEWTLMEKLSLAGLVLSGVGLVWQMTAR
jgi:hypothetical protein